MVDIVDFSTWQPYEGAAEGSGMSEKQWLVSSTGQIGLFKYPKMDPISKRTTFEHVSEHLGSAIGSMLGVETARVDIGTYHGRIGSMSYLS